MARFYASKETVDLAGVPSLTAATARDGQPLEAGVMVHGVRDALDINPTMTLNCLPAAAVDSLSQAYPAGHPAQAELVKGP